MKAMPQFLSKKTYPEKTLGEKLKLLRRRKHLSLEQAEEETKVRLKYLEALEKGEYTRLPADVYTLGFLAKYADFLGGPREELLKQYREERKGRAEDLFAPKRRFRENRVYLTPQRMILMGVFLGLTFLVVYLFYAIKNFTSPPNLAISSPGAESIIREDSIEIIGKTDPGASLKINEQTIFIDDKGNFRETVKLQPGLNNIEIKAINRLKKETVKIIKILAEF